MNISGALLLLHDLNEFLNVYEFKGYEKAKREAVEIANAMDIPVTFESRRRGRPVQSTTAEEHFKKNFFECMINKAKISISERFEAFSAHNKIFSFLYETDLIEKRYNSGALIPLCMDLKKALSQGGQSDIDGNALFNELRIVGKMLKENSIKNIIDVINLIVNKRLETVLPNAIIAYRILLTIPVSVASGERSFSKMKIIKTYLRNRMGQSRLSDLAIISIEKDIAKLLNYDDVITDFANLKSRKFGTL